MGYAAYLPKSEGVNGCSYPFTFWLRVVDQLKDRFWPEDIQQCHTKTN